MSRMPAIALTAVPGRRARTVALAKEMESRGFEGIFCPSLGDAMSLCLAIGLNTSTIRFGTSIQPIYLQHPVQLAAQAAFIHEMSGGRFILGIGVSHGPMVSSLGVQTGKPLSDIRDYVAALRRAEKQAGPLPPIMLAALRPKMTAVAGEIAEGAVWANACRGAFPGALDPVPADKRAGGFFAANMLPTVIDDDEQAAAAVCRKTLIGYVALPNYRNFYKSVGFEEEMTKIEVALKEGRRDDVPGLMSDRWLDEATLFGPLGKVRERVDDWYTTGVTPIVVPSSTKGGQMVAIDEIFAAFA